MNGLATLQEEALRALIRVWGTDRVVLMGGAALAVLTGMPWRTTLDLDLVVVSEIAESDLALAALEGWERSRAQEHRWSFRGQVHGDILPVTEKALSDGELRWPRSAAVLSTVGLDLALRRATTVRLSDGTPLRVAPLPVLVVLKAVAFLDRPHDRARDLGDIAWIMHVYVPDEAERRFDPRFVTIDVQYDEGSAFLLGEAVREMAERHLPLLKRFLRCVEVSWLDTLAALAPRAWDRSREGVLRQLRAFRRGMGGAAA
jgi:predicted nucleotidyltransferase